MSLADELRQLQELREGGALSDAEYAQAKARVIGGAPPPMPDAARSPDRPARERPAAPDSPPRPAGNPYLPLIAIVLVVAALAVVFFVVGPGMFGKRESAGLTLKVDRVESSPEGFRVHMTATNHTRDALRLPLFGYFFVTDDLGNQYKADPFASTFPQDVAPGATVSGYALMEQPLNPGATRLKVAFTTVFGSFAVRSAAVENVPVR
jgi:hypothetical protein